jgi:hypothetical protein
MSLNFAKHKNINVSARRRIVHGLGWHGRVFMPVGVSQLRAHAHEYVPVPPITQ